MRTIKALVCVGAVLAGIASAMAQNVYSLNVVGYYNVTVGAGQKVIIANQLNTTNNTIGALLQEPMIGNGDQLFKYNAGFSASSYSSDDGAWSVPTMTLNVGEAAFYQPQAARTLTFVGEVMQGQLVNSLPLGTKVLRSSMVPQQGLISVDLAVVPDNGDQLYVFNTAQNSGGYQNFFYSADDGAWSPTEPTIAVGQGFFYQKSPTGTPANANWTRNFTVQ